MTLLGWHGNGIGVINKGTAAFLWLSCLELLDSSNTSFAFAYLMWETALGELAGVPCAVILRAASIAWCVLV